MNYETEIRSNAGRFGVDPILIGGLCKVESGFLPWAWNPEPKFRYLWNVSTKAAFRKVTDLEIASETPPADFPVLAGDRDQEWWGQQASWGLMQLMGAVAREHDFRGPYLPELCNPDVNLAIGCRLISELLSWASGDVERALAAYNGGKGGNMTRPFRNQAYADKVIAARSILKTVGG